MAADRDEVRQDDGIPRGQGEKDAAAAGEGAAAEAAERAQGGSPEGVSAAEPAGRAAEPAASGEAGGAGRSGEPEEGPQTAEGAEPAQPTLEEVLAERDRLAEENGRLREERDRLAAAYQQLRDAHLRLQADFDNFRRRTREEEARRKLEAAESVLRDVLPVVDNMERAVRATKGDGAPPPEGALEAIRAGVELILQQLRGILEKHGVTPVPGVGEPFDPRWHHAVETVEERAGEASEGSSAAADAPLVVVEEFQKGYMLGGRVIRPSLVKVGAAPLRNASDESGKGNTL